MPHTEQGIPPLDTPRPPGATGALVLADGTIYWGQGVGATGMSVGEVVFNTSMTGYQEVLTDPSYAGQIITFTFPHIGNVGTNPEDVETLHPAARGLILRAEITEPANWRSVRPLTEWLTAHGMIGLTGIDTRALTRRIRDRGAPNGVVVHAAEGIPDVQAAWKLAAGWPGLIGMDLAKEVTCAKGFDWDQTAWRHGHGHGSQSEPQFHVVAIDFGAKHNILRSLASTGCKVTVLPANTSAEEVLKYRPDGFFLSNGPGDPSATGTYAVPMVKALLETGKPVFGICLGHQILALALGGKTKKMPTGHRGANHPVKDLATGVVEITCQNHGFVVDEGSLPPGVTVSHRSLFDGSVEGIQLTGKPVFSVQYHPEASPGPRDSHYLFRRFVDLMATK